MKLHALISTLMIVLAPLASSAHEGHDHAPGVIQAPHGGVAKAGTHVSLELVTEGKTLKLYPLDAATKPLAGARVSATAQLPKSKKKETVSLTSKGEYFEGTFASGGAYRYTLEVKVGVGKVKDEKFVFQVEP